MNLQQHKEIILRWINSCETSEQLDLLLEVIVEFVTKRFEGRAEPLELSITKDDLSNALTDKKMDIVRVTFDRDELAPTLAVYNQ